MNSKIFSHVIKKLQDTWHLPRHKQIKDSLSENTKLDDLPWTPARLKKFHSALENDFGVKINQISGTVAEFVDYINEAVLTEFFGQVWKPRTASYTWTGYKIAEEINKCNPKNVLDVGCGYNQFKELIPNLTGLDPYNNNADIMLDIADYTVDPASFDHVIALGSINFGSKNDIEKRFAKVVELLVPGGRLWMRCNPGIDHTAGPGKWVEIFPWNFGVAHELAKKYGLTLKTLKKDHDRLFFLFVKN